MSIYGPNYEFLLYDDDVAIKWAHYCTHNLLIDDPRRRRRWSSPLQRPTPPPLSIGCVLCVLFFPPSASSSSRERCDLLEPVQQPDAGALFPSSSPRPSSLPKRSGMRPRVLPGRPPLTSHRPDRRACPPRPQPPSAVCSDPSPLATTAPASAASTTRGGASRVEGWGGPHPKN
jgi:hypothetical protein